MRCAHASVLVLLLAGCGDDVAGAPVPLAEVCGVDGPHRLLPLDADETLLPWRSPTRLGERLYYVAATGVTEAFSDSPQPAPRDVTVYSTGPCGEDPLVVARDVQRVFADPHFPDLILGCAGDLRGDLVALDPTGVAAPRLLLADGCDSRFTDHGLLRLIANDDEPARLLLHPYPIQPTETPIVLHEALRPGSFLWPFAPTDVGVWMIDTADQLVHVSLPDGEVRVEQPSVHDFGISDDDRFLVWQDLAGTAEIDGRSAGPIWLRDRTESEDIVLAASASPYVHPLSGRGLVHLWLGSGQSRVIALPSLASVDLPGSPWIHTQVDDGRYLMTSGVSGPWSLVDFTTGELTHLTDAVGAGSFSMGPTALEMRQLDDPSGNSRSEGPLWRYRYDGSEPELLAARVSGLHQNLSDGRIVTLLDLDERGVGQLVVIDPDTLAERSIDEHVRATAPLRPFITDLFDPDTLVYTVSDGERSGVWMARPAAD